MGLIRAGLGALGGTLADQRIRLIRRNSALSAATCSTKTTVSK